MTPPEIADTFSHLWQPAYLCAALAVILLALALYFLAGRQPRAILAYTTENGRLMISRAAIGELVRSACAQLDDIERPRVRLRVRGRKAHFKVFIKLKSGACLREIEATLQKHLRRELRENLGIERLGTIDIVATGIESGPVERGTSRTEDEPGADAAADDNDAANRL